jgi:hypothetical protein
MVKSTETIHLALPVGMTSWIDQERGDISRSKFVSRILEKALKNSEKRRKPKDA